MNRLTLASLALLVVAALGSTGCSYHYRYRGRYAHARYCDYAAHVRAPVYYAPGAAPQAPPAEEVAPPAEPPAPPAPPVVQAGPRPIVVHAYVPGTTVIVVNPPAGGPAVGHVVAPPPQAQPAPRQEAPQQENPNGWFEEE